LGVALGVGLGVATDRTSVPRRKHWRIELATAPRFTAVFRKHVATGISVANPLQVDTPEHNIAHASALVVVVLLISLPGQSIPWLIWV